MKILRNILISVCIFVAVGAIIGITYYYKSIQSGMDILEEGYVDDGKEYTVSVGLHGYKTFSEQMHMTNYLAQLRILNGIIKILEISAALGVIGGISYSAIVVEIEKKNNKLKV